MMDESKNSPFQKSIRKHVSEAQGIGTEKASRINVAISRERRIYPRKSCFLSVNYATDERAYQEFIQDISTSGVFIETRYPLPIGQNIALTFSLPSRPEHIKLTGCIARTTPQGIGVTFIRQSVDQKNYLSSHIVNM